MITVRIWTFALLAILSCVLETNAEDKVALGVLRATVQILVKDQQNNVLGKGSGVVVSPDGHILTAKHVLNEYYKSPDTRNVFVRMNNPNLILQPESRVSVVGRDPNIDLALLHLPARDLPYLRKGNSSLVEMNERLMASGFGAGSETVLSKFGHRSGLTWEVDNPLSEGFSGGPVVKDGCDVLVGIVSGGLQDSSGVLIQGRSQIVPSNYGSGFFYQAASVNAATLCSETSSPSQPPDDPHPSNTGCKEVTISERVNGVVTWSKKCL